MCVQVTHAENCRNGMSYRRETVPHSTLSAPWVCLLTMVMKGLRGPMWGLTSLFLRLEETITSGLDQGLVLHGADK